VSYSRILVRATNWVGDAVMSLPALRALRAAYPRAHVAVLAKPWVAGLYARERFADEVIPYPAEKLTEKLRFARSLRAHGFDAAILLQNAFEAALIARVAGIPNRIGYNRDARGWLLTQAVRPPKPGEIPRHERFYYLELLRRAGIINALPPSDEIRLDGAEAARQEGLASLLARGFESPVIGLSPGAAFGTAKRWLPERFADAAVRVARLRGASVAIFGSASERPLCETVAALVGAQEIPCHNFAGETSLTDYISLAAACDVYLTNDSGSMHIASALGVPTVAIFGATDADATGPTGSLARIVREPVDCSPCLLRTCPIDHRCMKRVEAGRVADVALELMGLPNGAARRLES
jgi:heptosyltransferase-2